MTLTLTYYSINTFLRYQIILFIATETHICKQLTKSRHVTVNQARKRSIDCSACSILPRINVLTRDIDTAILSVCPAVRQVPVLYRNG